MMARRRSGGRKQAMFEALESRVLLSSAPIGRIDGANRFAIGGWALDRDEGPLPMQVEITLNGTVHTVVANQYRPDLAGVYGYAYNGWSFTPPSSLPPGTSSVIVDVVNPSTGERTRLGERSITNIAPVGAVEEVSSTRIRGFVYDNDKPAGGAKVRIDIDGVQGTPFAATVSRPELAGLLKTSAVGFDVTGSFAGKMIEIYRLDEPSGTAVLMWSNNRQPLGKLEVTHPKWLIGWAFDVDAPEKAVQIRIDIDGVKGTPFAAETARTDLQSYWGSPNHGWVKYLMDLTPGTHTLDVYMIDPEATGASPVLLGSRTIVNNVPEGAVETLSGTQMKGWAFDEDLGSAAAKVRVYVDDYLFATLNASEARPDLTATLGSANHGFTVDMSSLPAGSHAVTVTVEDDRNSAQDEVVIFDGFINNTPPTGVLESVTATTISGWVYDPDSPTTSIDVDVFVDGGFYGTVKADANRPDLVGAIGSANHGFVVDLPVLSFGTHTIAVYAAESQGTVSTLIGSKTVTNARPKGSLDVVTGGSIFGWAGDLDVPLTALDVVVYINGVATTSALANKQRDDLVGLFGTAYHGFIVSMPSLEAGTYQVDVYAIDRNNGLRTAVGSKVVVV